MKILWHSNFSVHKVLWEHSHIHPFTKHQWLLSQRHNNNGDYIYYLPLYSLLSSDREDGWKKKAYARASGSERPVEKWPGTELGLSGNWGGESRVVSGHRVSNQQGAWMKSKVMSGIISGFSSEELGRRGGCTPPEWEDAGQMGGWGALDTAAG